MYLHNESTESGPGRALVSDPVPVAVQTTVSTIRHAQTVYNVERRYAGSRDVPLSEAGIREARAAADVLGQVKFDVVVTSMLQRSLETAQLLVGETVPIVQTSLCNERRFGIMEGLTWEEVRQLQPPVLMIEVGGDLHTVNPEGGEPFEVVWERAKAFRRFLFRNHRGLSILVVSHGVFLQLFHGLLRGLSCIESLGSYPSNLELARFSFSGERLEGERVIQVGELESIRW